MGCGLYIYAVNYSSQGLIANAFIAPIPFIALVIYKICILINNKIKKGKFLDLENSNFIDKQNNLKWNNLKPLIGNWYANTAHIFLITYAFKFAKLGGLN